MASVIDTLGKAARHGMLLRVSCRTCGHSGLFQTRDLASLYGDGRSPHALRFRCHRCSARNFETTVLDYDRDRKPKGAVVWTPQRIG